MKRLSVYLLLGLGLSGCMGSTIQNAAYNGMDARVREFLDKGVPVNQDQYGGTPLEYAIAARRASTVDLLLSKGASVNRPGPDGTPLDKALAVSGNYEVVKVLRAHGGKTTLELDSAPVKAPPSPENLGDDSNDRTRPAAALPPERTEEASDVDAPAERGAERPDDFALVIGIERYSKLPAARFAENDAATVKKHLLALGYPERNIITLKGGQATRGAIQGYVEEWLPKNAKPGSRIFVYFSGHGSPDTKTGDAYLVPWDGDAMFLKSTAYPLKSLYASLSKLKAKRVLVALDSCFSGAGGRSVLAEGARPLVTRLDEVSAPAGVTVLSAASGDEITATLKDQGHGAFTYYLLKALNDGKLTAKAAYDELKPLVQDEAHRQNREQTPLLLGDDASF